MPKYWRASVDRPKSPSDKNSSGLPYSIYQANNTMMVMMMKMMKMMMMMIMMMMMMI